MSICWGEKEGDGYYRVGAGSNGLIWDVYFLGKSMVMSCHGLLPRIMSGSMALLLLVSVFMLMASLNQRP